MVFVGSSFGHYVDYGAAGESVLGVVLARIYLNFLNPFDGRRHAHIGVLGLAIGDALNEDAIGVSVHAAQRSELIAGQSHRRAVLAAIQTIVAAAAIVVRPRHEI